MEAVEEKTEGAVGVEEEEREALNLKVDPVGHSGEQSLKVALVPNRQARQLRQRSLKTEQSIEKPCKILFNAN